MMSSIRTVQKSFALAATILVIVAASACNQAKSPASATETSPSTNALSTLASQGKTVYQTNCIACHHSNPRQPGSIGPDVWGSSKALLEARIISASYPEGYKPKRASHAMAPLPHLKGEIDALHAYLNSQGQ